MVVGRGALSRGVSGEESATVGQGRASIRGSGNRTPMAGCRHRNTDPLVIIRTAHVVVAAGAQELAAALDELSGAVGAGADQSLGVDPNGFRWASCFSSFGFFHVFLRARL